MNRAALLSLLPLLCQTAVAEKPSITLLTDPSGELQLVTAKAVTRGGSFIIGTAGKEGAEGTVAFRWSRDGGVLMVGDMPGGKIFAQANDITDDGRIVVGYSSSARGTEAFGWAEKSGMISLGDFEGGKFSSRAMGVSADGKTIVGSGVAEGAGSSRRHGDAFIWSGGKGMQMLSPIEPFEDTMWASDVSADGSTVVGKGDSKNGSEAFRWSLGKMQGLGCLLEGRMNFYSEAVACSSDGKIVVGNSGHSNGERKAFIWTEEDGMKSLGDLEGELKSNVIGVSDGGRVLGISSTRRSSVAFLWEKGTGKISLDEKLKKLGYNPTDDSWIQYQNLFGISPCGRYLVGSGLRSGEKISERGPILIDLGEEG
jgi:probable HAF family extracellular repeat protein